MSGQSNQPGETTPFGEPAGYTDDGVPLYRVCDIAKHIGIDADVLAAGIIAKLNGLPLDALIGLPDSQKELN